MVLSVVGVSSSSLSERCCFGAARWGFSHRRKKLTMTVTGHSHVRHGDLYRPYSACNTVIFRLCAVTVLVENWHSASPGGPDVSC